MADNTPAPLSSPPPTAGSARVQHGGLGVDGKGVSVDGNNSENDALGFAVWLPSALTGTALIAGVASSVWLSGTARFWSLLVVVAIVLLFTASIAVLLAGLARRRRRRLLAAAILLAVPPLWLLVGYAVVGAQAESVSGTELIGNMLTALVVIGGAVATVGFVEARTRTVKRT